MKSELLATDFLDHAIDLYGNSTGVIADDGAAYTYAEFGDRVNQLSRGLTELGVEQGDRVAVLSPNTHWFLETLYATVQLGAIHVALNYRLTPKDYEYILEDCGADVVIADYEYAGKVQAVRDDVDVEQFVGYESDRIDGDWRSYEALLAGRATSRPDRPGIDDDDPAIINYTGGTTGTPTSGRCRCSTATAGATSMPSPVSVGHTSASGTSTPSGRSRRSASTTSRISVARR